MSSTPIELGPIYRFPPGTDGSGQSIAIIELGGGFAQAELSTYFTSLGITGPTVTAVGVDGAKNQPGKDPAGAGGEVLPDIQVAGALSPGSAMVVYFA
ncbi:peptidase S53, partial [Lacisediminihabitans profunda]